MPDLRILLMIAHPSTQCPGINPIPDMPRTPVQPQDASRRFLSNELIRDEQQRELHRAHQQTTGHFLNRVFRALLCSSVSMLPIRVHDAELASQLHAQQGYGWPSGQPPAACALLDETIKNQTYISPAGVHVQVHTWVSMHEGKGAGR